MHVIERQVIFVDLALAQIAALGASLALLFHSSVEGPQAYALSLGFTVLGAVIFSFSRFRKQRIPQEAIIGIVYAVSASFLLLVLSGSGEGDEHMRQALVGNILLVTPAEVIQMGLIYLCIGVFHFACRKQFFLISQDPEKAFASGVNVRFWDFLFYASFGIVVTSSVKIAGVLLVFVFLVVPASCAILFSSDTKTKLAIGWAVGFFASVFGMALSYFLDLPTGASVVCAFGGILILMALLQVALKK
jgi:zinc/manganese transport system permease protein